MCECKSALARHSNVRMVGTMKRWIAGLMLMSAAVTGLRATTLAPFTFEDQVSGAAEIFRGRVTAIETEKRSTKRGEAIFTKVTFAVLEVFKGKPDATRTLDFLGGTLDDESMIVEGMPRFAKEQEVILFVSGDPGLVCPVLGWSEGKLAVEGDQVVLPDRAQDSASAARARKAIRSDDRMTLGDFRQLLKTRLSQASSTK